MVELMPVSVLSNQQRENHVRYAGDISQQTFEPKR